MYSCEKQRTLYINTSVSYDLNVFIKFTLVRNVISVERDQVQIYLQNLNRFRFKSSSYYGQGQAWNYYTGCPRRKGPNFGRVFLRSNYTDITKNTYIQSSMVTEILAREKCGCLLCLGTVLCPWRHTSHMHLPSTR